MLSPEEIKRLRKDTPASANIAHLNNAGAALIPTPVHAAVLDHLERERAWGGYEAAAHAEPTAARFYTAAAELIGAQPEEIAYAQNASRAWAMAVYGLDLNEGDEILCHESEYGANGLALLQLCQRRCLHLKKVRSDGIGRIDIEALEQAISPRTRAIFLTHVPMYRGVINPVSAVGEIAKSHGLIYVLDGAQSLGQMPVRVKDIGCDILVGTGRKFLRGPRGTGFLFVSNACVEAIEPPVIDNQSALWEGSNGFRYAPGAQRFETWERHLAGQIGLACALDYALSLGLEEIQATIAPRALDIRQKLSEIEGFTLLDDPSLPSLSAIVTFYHERLSARDILQQARAMGVNLSIVRQAQTWDAFSPDMPDEIVRASPHYYNTPQEVDRLCEVLRSL